MKNKYKGRRGEDGALAAPSGDAPRRRTLKSASGDADNRSDATDPNKRLARPGTKSADAPKPSRPHGDRPFRERGGDDRPRGDRPFRDRGGDDRPRGDRPFRERGGDDRPRGDRPFRERGGDDRPRGDRPYRDRGGDDRPRGDRPYRERSGDDRPRGDRPFRDRGGDDRPRGDRPYRERSGDDRPRGDRPFRDRGGDDRPRGDRPFRDRGGDRPFRDRGGDDRPRGDRPYRERGGDDRPRGDRPFRERGGDDRPRGDRPFRERGGDDRPRGDRPFRDRGGDDRPRGDRPYRDRGSDDRPRGDRPFRERGGDDRPRGDRPFRERGGDDRPRGDRPFRDRGGDDRPRGDRPYRERNRDENTERNEKPRKAHFKPAPIPETGLEGMAAREAAVILVGEVLNEHRSLDELLADDDFPQLSQMSRADKGFARAMAATALRRLGQIDDALSRFMEKGLPRSAGPLREILAVAAAQLMFLDSPPHAVINVAVQQAKNHPESQPFAKLTNAVLRRVSENFNEIVAEQDAGRLNTPEWLRTAWEEAYGAETAAQICEAHLEPALLDLTVKEDPALWAEKLRGTLLSTGSIRLRHKGRVETIKGFDEGAWWVQDAAAALPARLLGDVKGRRVADLAAAPGGKTAQLAAAGADVTAVDWSAGRLERLEENMERLHLQAEVVKSDVLEWKPKGMFDAILLDAPCTATGTIRRHPDLPFLKKPSDLDELTNLQAAMIDKALMHLKPGGLLVYCVCSLQQEEGPKQIEALMERDDEVEVVPVEADEAGIKAEWITEQGYLRTLPFHQPADDIEPGLDGFFAARLRLKG